MNDERSRPADDGFTLLDGVSPSEQDIIREYGSQHLVASDLSRPLAERLGAFEDVFESEVGDTTIARARNIERGFPYSSAEPLWLTAVVGRKAVTAQARQT